MSKCLNCDKPVEQTNGKRKRKYCSDNCRATHYQKNKPKEQRYVLKSRYDELLKQVNGRDNQFENAAKGRDVSGINEDKLKPMPVIEVMAQKPERLKGESSLDYKIRCAELEKLK